MKKLFDFGKKQLECRKQKIQMIQELEVKIIWLSLKQIKKLGLRNSCINPFVKTILFML